MKLCSPYALINAGIDFGSVILFVALEHILILVKFVVQALVPDVPRR